MKPHQTYTCPFCQTTQTKASPHPCTHRDSFFSEFREIAQPQVYKSVNMAGKIKRTWKQGEN